MLRVNYCLYLFIIFIFFSCEKDDTEELPKQFDRSTLEDGIADDVCYFNNPPYPVDADTLRILAIGNSFTDDAMTYIDALVKASNIDDSKLCLYEASKGGASLDMWIDYFNSDTNIYLRHITGKIQMDSQGTMSQLLAQPWDVIVIQQVSNLSYLWSSYSYLKEYIEIINSACTNKKVCLAFQLVWSHTQAEMPYVLQGNVACCQKMTQRYGIDVIIPTGTAIQLARETNLNDALYMTRDRWHLNLGIASYIASCTWFEALLRPVYGIPVVGNTAKPEGDYSENDILLGQKCAEQSVQHPYYYY
jgi:hypothetical protein